MSSLISGSGFIQAAVFRMCCGWIFVGLAVAVHAAWSEEYSFVRDLDILMIQPVRSEAGGLFPYRINTSIVLTGPENNAPAGSVFSNAPQLHILVESKQEGIFSAYERWKMTSDSDRVSFLPILRLESKGEWIEIKPRRHSIWVEWRKALP